MRTIIKDRTDLQNQNELWRYLLGQLSGQEEQELVQKYGGSGALSEAVQIAEDDLIDAYVYRELTEAQRLRFEEYFLNASAQRRQHVEIAQWIMNSEVRAQVAASAVGTFPRRAPGWKPLFTMPTLPVLSLAAVAVVLCAVLIIENRRLANELNRSKTLQSALQSTIDDLRKTPAPPGSGPAQNDLGTGRTSPAVTALMLTPGMLRTASDHPVETLKLSAASSVAVFMLVLDPSIRTKHARYDVVFQTVEGKKVQAVGNVASKELPDGLEVVPVDLPTRTFAENDYFITLLARADGRSREVASYTFSATR